MDMKGAYVSIQGRQLQMTDQRTFEDFRLADVPTERRREIAVVGSAYDSILSSGFTYVSTPITSGAALYRAMDEQGVTTLEDLRRDKEAFARLVIEPNLAAADGVARAMMSFGGAVIAPAAFEARSLGWDQDAYMGLWLDTIERKATRLALVDGWQYSNGGAEEYLQALLMQAGRRDRGDIEIVDARGAVLPHHEAIVLLSDAVDDLHRRGFTPTTLIRTLHRIVTLHGMILDESSYGLLADRCGRTRFVVDNTFSEAEDVERILVARRDAFRSLAPVWHVLDARERGIVSSLDMAPGLVRTDGRTELSDLHAMVAMPTPPRDPESSME